MSAWRRLSWYARRLSVMSPPEIAHRLAEAGNLQWLQLQASRGRGWGRADPRLAETAAFCNANHPQLPDLEWTFDAGGASASEALRGQLMALGYAWQWQPVDDVWHRAPDTGRLWPRRFFGAIPYREGNPYGDVRVAWEPSRLQWLVTLALIARGRRDAQAGHAIELLQDALLSWVAANPPLVGIHYISAMECALRLIAVCHAVDLARSQLTRPRQVYEALVSIVASHAALISGRLSLYSSAGNHTVAEAAGLIYAGVLFPELAGADRWKRQGLSLLDSELRRQVLDDGGGIEQAFWYLRFITDLGALVAALLRCRGETVPAGLVDRLPRAQRFLSLMEEACGQVPPVGDADDGHALSPWLRCRSETEYEVAKTAIVDFPDAGYLLWRAAAPGRTTVLFDHGPLGMAPAFAHGHADALSVQMWCDGREVLVDTGTFTYTGEPAARRYFRSTAAHNTVIVDDSDQARQTSAFMWAGPCDCELVRIDARPGLSRALARYRGSFDGDGIIHWRGLSLRDSGSVLVWDFIEGGGAHKLMLAWHVALPVEGAGPRWRLGEDMILEIHGADELRSYRGGSHAGPGLRSTGYGRMQPICTITAAARKPLPCQFVTRVFNGREADLQDPMTEDIATFRSWMT